MATIGAPPGRGARLVDAALEIAAEHGLAAVTHRSVQTAAGMPHGSVTYWFGNREGLLAAMVDRLVEQCKAEVDPIAEGITAAFEAGEELDLDAVAAAVAAWIDEGREMHLARLELELAAARDPILRERMRAAASIFWRLCEPLARAAGSDNPERDGRAMAAMVDGLLLDRLSHPPQPRGLLVAAVRRLLTTHGWTAGTAAGDDAAAAAGASRRPRSAPTA
jgi:AcrR family transcriptional regulator